MAREDQSAWNIFFRSGDIGAFTEDRNWFSKSTAEEREAGHTTGAVFDHNLDRAGDAIADGYDAVTDVAQDVAAPVLAPVEALGELFGGVF